MDQYTIKRTLLKSSSLPRKAWLNNMLPKTPDALFIWIPKSAGTSVFTALTEIGMRKFKSIDKTRYLFTNKGLVTFVHQSVPALVTAGAVSQSFVTRALKFSFVRNPYARTASLYRYFQKMNRISKEMTFHQFLAILEKEWLIHSSLPAPTLASMTDRLNYYGEEFHHGCSDLYPVGPYNSLEWSQCRPQIDWLEGVAPMNEIHVGRMENLDKDFQTILTKLRHSTNGEKIPPLTVPRVNTTSESGDCIHRDYKDPAFKRIVERIYAKDFETFSY